jgi:outer membrane lipopolysaccharide assembly protein LptE/RlpB
VNRTIKLALVALALLNAGCGYALAGRGNALPDHIRRIGVPTFTNHSDTPELDRILAEAVREELRGRGGRFTIVQESTGVDAVLTATVNPVTVTPAALNENRQAQRYLITVNATIEFKDTKDNKVLWSNPGLRVSDEYDAAVGVSVVNPAAIFTQDQNALSRIAKAFARSLVTSMLEAF